MGTRGRRSAAALTVVPSGDVVAIPKTPPPLELTPEQGTEWRAVVAARPADWFGRESHALLVQYCRHVVAARRVADLIYQTEHADGAFDVEGYDRLLKMQEREGRALSSLAVRMRICQHSLYSAHKKGKTPMERRPWEDC